MTDAPNIPPATPRPSAAIALLREREGGGVEVFMVRRHVQSEFVPDVFVFPGGSVKPEDRETEQAVGICAAVEPAPTGETTLGSGLRAAALRECFEEAGVLLAWPAAQPQGETSGETSGETGLAPTGTADLAARLAAYRADLLNKATTLRAIAETEHFTLATNALLPWAHWITPEQMPKRFDTYFFLAAMPQDQEAAHDQIETTDSAWITPEEALRGFEAGTFPLVFATVHQLRTLAGLRGLDAARERFAGTTPRTIAPRIVQRDGASVIVLPDEA